MDVGLNNRNTLGNEDKALADVVFLVEANSNEHLQLWSEWSTESMTNIEPLDKKDLTEVLLSIEKSNLPLTKILSLTKNITDLNKKVEDVKRERVEWKQISSGFLLTIGHVTHNGEKLPVCIEFSFAIIKGKKVCFYHNCSRAGDSKMVENWLISRFQLTHDNYSRWNHVDAMNFHNCMNSLDDLDVEPRDTVYELENV